jgi:DNA-3-methyladenine glycosylase
MTDRTSPRLRRPFFATDPTSLARALLGQRLVRVLEDGTRLAGVIVETEAYLGVPDKAAHTAGGRRTPRNEAMYGQPGTAYVYFTYGCHFCMNVVAGKVDEPVAVLIRALQPTEGLERICEHRLAGLRIRSRRGNGEFLPPPPPPAIEDLCRGPGRLCEALAIDRSLNAVDLATDSRLFLERARTRPLGDARVGVSPRIGVDYAEEWTARPLRFFIRGSEFLSGPRRLNT